MKIKTSTLLATAKAIYQAHYDFGDGSEPPLFERQPPLAKDVYGRMAKAAAEAINRDYQWRERAERRPTEEPVIIPKSRDIPSESTP